jgi:tetraacyldisaccharide 4'-kinase
LFGDISVIATYYERLISGVEKGFVAALLRTFLGFVSLLYLAAFYLRKALYALRIIRVRSLPCKVISVGNITLGGTGKTPFVEYIARFISQRGVKTAIISRGYKQTGNAAADEVLLLKELIPEVPLYVGARRYLAGERAIRETGAECIILDDGFAHWRLARDLDIILIDSLNPFGHARIFPRGMLREPLSGLARASIFVLTKIDHCPKDVIGALRNYLGKSHPQVPQILTRHKPTHLEKIPGRENVPLEFLKGKKITAFCGIGNPQGFHGVLKQLGAEVASFEIFSDHFRYSEKILSAIEKNSLLLKSEALITTHKDAVKVRWYKFSMPVFSLEIEIEVAENADELAQTITTVLQNSTSEELHNA